MDVDHSEAWANVAKEIRALPEGKLFGCHEVVEADGELPATHCRYLRRIEVTDAWFGDQRWLSDATRAEVSAVRPHHLFLECDLPIDAQRLPRDAPFSHCRPVMLEGTKGTLAFVDREYPFDMSKCSRGFGELGERRAFDLRGCSNGAGCLKAAVKMLVQELTTSMTTAPIGATASGPLRRGRMRFVTDHKASQVITNKPRHEIATYSVSISVDADPRLTIELPDELQFGRSTKDGGLAVHVDVEHFIMLAANHGGPYTNPKDEDDAAYAAALEAAYKRAVRRACDTFQGAMEGETCRPKNGR